MAEGNVVPGLARHFINDPEAAVLGSLESTVLVNPTLVLDKVNKIVFRNPSTIKDASSKVSVICGGGSGHEPAWAGFVGFRLLTAAVAGNIFASPGAEQVRACITHRLPKDSKGVLVIVKNYTGDVMNFGRAVEGAKAEGKNVEMIVVGDDVGVGREKGAKVGRRGLAGTVFVVKCCGALAELGGSLGDCTKIGRLVADNLATVAISLSRTHVVGKSSQDAKDEESRLPQGKVELGMGIHNEPGYDLLVADTQDNVKTMLKQLLDIDDKDRGFIDIRPESDKVVLLVNNFGGLSNFELGGITAEVSKQLRDDYKLQPLRVFSGTFVGSLDGRGFSVTLLKVQDTGLGQGRSITDLLDAPTDCAAWPIGASTGQGILPQILTEDNKDSSPPEIAGNLRVDPAHYEKVLVAGLHQVIAAEPEITKYDSLVGDGDCGTGLKRGAEAIIRSLGEHRPCTDLLINLSYVVQAVETSMDGTSGAVYAIFLNSLVHNLRLRNPKSPVDVTAAIWAKALGDALVGTRSYTPARVGDRTMMDALTPFIEELAASKDLKRAAEAAERGSESTKGMKASLGRTVYVGGGSYKEVPDPGAYGLAAFVEGMAGVT